ncbi:MAG: calcium/sodium antiporter [Planctomycetota bacterium]
MAWILDIAFLVVGLTLLVLAADWLIQGAGVIARKLGVSPLVIGLTVVAFGTSAPELAAAIGAVLKGELDIPIGNAVGSNIANVGLILGLVALVRPFPCESRVVRFDVLVMILITGLAMWLLWDARVTRIEAGVLVALLFGYVAMTYLISADGKDEFAVEMTREAEADFGDGSRQLRAAFVKTAVGVVGLAGGAWLLVRGAVGLATVIGVPEYVIALVMVALGTSLPELAAAFAAVRKNEPDLAVGNVLGSNVFNLLCVVGVSGLVGKLEAPINSLHRDLSVMAVFAVLCGPFLAWGKRLRRWEGLVLFGAYIGYIVVVFRS